jgi:hypothetical protein
MARPRRGKRRRGDTFDWLTDYLITGMRPDLKDPRLNPFMVIRVTNSDSPDLREAWSRSRIMQDWNKPGCRPYAWWLFDAPRQSLPGIGGNTWDNKFPAPRIHLAGPGRPRHEAINYYPEQYFGIYAWYGDPENPPTHETQFEYLVRHGLLLPDECEPLPEPHKLPPSNMDAAKWDALRTRSNHE